MKIIAALALIAATVVDAQADIKPLILSGTIVPAGTKTFVTGSREKLTSTTKCGGALISPTHVLTAAHCRTIAKFVSVGSHYATGSADGERFAVKKQTLHPKYNGATVTYDYAILELEKPTTFMPIKLLSADSETFVGETATIAGWGNTRESSLLTPGYPSEELLRVNVPVLSIAECKTKGLKAYALTETMFCAGGEVNKDSCQGDSGGPLFLERPTGDVLVGVVSWGDGCGRENKPGVYSKVSYVKEWIQSIAPNSSWV